MASRVPCGGSGFESEEGRVQEELLGVGVFLTPIEAAGGGQAAMERGDRPQQTGARPEGGEEVQGLGTDHLGGFNE